MNSMLWCEISRPGKDDLLLIGQPAALRQDRLVRWHFRARAQGQGIAATGETVSTPDRLTERQRFSGAGHGDVEQAAFFVAILVPAITVQNQYMVELQSLGAMRRQ